MIAVVAPALLAIGTVSSRAATPPDTTPIKRVFVSGMDTTTPEAERSEGAYLLSFDKYVPLSYRESKGGEDALDRKLRDGADLLSARSDLSGEFSSRAAGELAPLRGHPIDTLVVHSWGTVAVLTAIESGAMLPPKNLIVVDPPAFRGKDVERWREFSAKNAATTQVDVYVGTRDRLKIIREDFFPEIRPAFIGPDAAYAAAFLDTSEGSRMSFHYFPGTHDVKDFLYFAARKGLYGISAQGVPGPAPAFMSPIGMPSDASPVNGEAFDRTAPYFAEAQARAIEFGKENSPTEWAKRLEDARAENEKARWDALAALVGLACDSPNLLEAESGREGAPSVIVSPELLDARYRPARSHLSGCERALLDHIQNHRGPLNFADFAREAHQYNKEHDPIRALQRFFVAAGRMIGQAFVSLGEVLKEMRDAQASSHHGGGGSFGGSSSSSGSVKVDRCLGISASNGYVSCQ